MASVVVALACSVVVSSAACSRGGASPATSASGEGGAEVFPAGGSGTPQGMPRPLTPALSTSTEPLLQRLRAQIEHVPTGAIDDNASPPIDSASEADVARALGVPASLGRHWRIAEWRAVPGRIVAASFRPRSFGSPLTALEPRVAVLTRADGGGLAVNADGVPQLAAAHCENESGEPPTDTQAARDVGGDERGPTVALDLALYRLTAERVAVGVRFTCQRAFPASEGDETQLVLLDVEGAKLRTVFAARLDWTEHDRVADEDTSEHGLLVVEPHATAGHFDLRVHVTATRTSLADGGSRVTTTTRRYAWVGERYVEKQ